MGKINPSTLIQWQDGNVITATKYKQEREIIVTANNDNDEKINDRYTKKQVDDFVLDIFGSGRKTESIMGNRTSILDLYTTRYSKTEADLLYKGKQDQIDQNKQDIRILYTDKLNITGNFTGTWNGVSMSEAAEAINGGRLDVLEPSFAKLKTDVYDVANATVSITHNLNDYPLVHAVGEIGFGFGGFGVFGFGDNKIAYPVQVEYPSENEAIIIFNEDLGVPTVTPINSRLYTANFSSGVSLTIKLI